MTPRLATAYLKGLLARKASAKPKCPYVQQSLVNSWLRGVSDWERYPEDAKHFLQQVRNVV